MAKAKLSVAQKIWGGIAAAGTGIGIGAGAGMSTYAILYHAISKGGLGYATLGTAGVVGSALTGLVMLVVALPIVYFIYSDYVRNAEQLLEKKRQADEENEKKEKAFNAALISLLIQCIHLKFLTEERGEVFNLQEVFAKEQIDPELQSNLEKLVDIIVDSKNADIKEAFSDYFKNPNDQVNKTALYEKLADEILADEIKPETKSQAEFSAEKMKLLSFRPQGPSKAPAIRAALLGGLGMFTTIVGGAGGVSALILGAGLITVLATTPIVGWSILGGALLLAAVAGGVYAYYQYQNSKKEADANNAVTLNKQLEEKTAAFNLVAEKVKEPLQVAEINSRQVEMKAEVTTKARAEAAAKVAAEVAEVEQRHEAAMKAQAEAMAKAAAEKAVEAAAKVAEEQRRADAAEAEAKKAQADAAAKVAEEKRRADTAETEAEKTRVEAATKVAEEKQRAESMKTRVDAAEAAVKAQAEEIAKLTEALAKQREQALHMASHPSRAPGEHPLTAVNSTLFHGHEHTSSTSHPTTTTPSHKKEAKEEEGDAKEEGERPPH